MIPDKTDKTFLFRFDVSASIGIGHLRRCCILARALKQKGCEILAVCRGETDKWADEFRELVDGWLEISWESDPVEDAQKLTALAVENKVDIVIVDHYRCRPEYQQVLLDRQIRWLQFDWSASFNLYADWIVNASPSTTATKYLSLLKKQDASVLLGPAYALLDTYVTKYRRNPDLHHEVKRVAISLGGGDDKGMIIKCLTSLCKITLPVEIHIFVTNLNPNIENIRRLLSTGMNRGIVLHTDDWRLVEPLSQMDLGILAGGTTTFEAAAIGLPMILVQMANNQGPNCRAWEETGAAVNLGRAEEFTSERLCETVRALFNDPQRRQLMAQSGQKLVDCKGAERICRQLFSRDLESQTGVRQR